MVFILTRFNSHHNTPTGSLVCLEDTWCTCGSLGERLVTCETLHELVVMWCTCGSLGMLVKHVVNVLVTCMLGGDVVHVRVSGYVCMPLDASTGHLCAWMTCGSHVGHLIRLEDT